MLIEVGGHTLKLDAITDILNPDKHIQHNVLGGTTLYYFEILVGSAVVQVQYLDYTSLVESRAKLIEVWRQNEEKN